MRLGGRLVESGVGALDCCQLLLVLRPALSVLGVHRQPARLVLLRCDGHSPFLEVREPRLGDEQRIESKFDALAGRERGV